MRSTKRYTNATFTKRVDHDAGRHRGPRAPAEPLRCSGCGAVYTKRRWVPPASERAAMLRSSAAETLCPACEMREAGTARGYLTLEGGFLVTHRADLEALIRAEDARSADVNPTARILAWDESVPGVLTITTSTEHLVVRMGHALERAFGGSTEYRFSHENKLARAFWRRD